MESSLDNETIEDTLLRLRILAKFLGYLHFPAYPSSASVQQQLHHHHLNKEMIAVRSHAAAMPLDLAWHVEQAVARRHTALTVPFVCEFLSMMDASAVHIERVQACVAALLAIFLSPRMRMATGSGGDEAFNANKLLVLLYIAWLVQLKKLPYNTANSQLWQRASSSAAAASAAAKCSGLDDVLIVTPLLLHQCCPYLDELHKMLTRFAYCGVKRSTAAACVIRDVSHVLSFEFASSCSPSKAPPGAKVSTLLLPHPTTPTTNAVQKAASEEEVVAKPSSSSSSSERQLNESQQRHVQLKLMAHFLFLHPSLKRQVDFLSECLFANFVIDFRQNELRRLMSALAEDACAALDKLDSKDSIDLSESEVNNRLRNQVKVKELRNKKNNFFCEKKC